MFVSPIVAKKTAAVCRKLEYVERIVLIEGESVDNFTVSLSELVKQHEKIEFDINDFFSEKIDIHEQVALIFCSSGTTGMPK